MAAKVAGRRTKETVLQRYGKNAGSYKYAKRIRPRRGLQNVRGKGIKVLLTKMSEERDGELFSTAPRLHLGLEAG